MSNRKALSPLQGEDARRRWTTWYVQQARKDRIKRADRERDPLADLIQQLFGNGEQGAFYLPQPVVNGEQVLFQDAAGTIPVTADGDPVGLLKDLSGNGNDASQSTSASRPAYRTDGSLHWIEFDGVDDYLTDGGSFTVTGQDQSYMAVSSVFTGSVSSNDGFFSYSNGDLVSGSARAIDFGSSTSLKIDAISVGVSLAVPDATVNPLVCEGVFGDGIKGAYDGGAFSSTASGINTQAAQARIGVGVLDSGFSEGKVFGAIHVVTEDYEGFRASLVGYLKGLNGTSAL